MILKANNKTLVLDRPHVMGILNVTPDSFSDGGKFNSLDNALQQAERMIQAGVCIIDIGGESTRPGAPDVSLEEELARVIPAIKAIRTKFDVWISIDTSKAEVMRQAVEAGADLINDVRALQEPGALQAAAEANVPVCLMHMKGQPRTMQASPVYDDVLMDVE
ncbi:dihydropteroate synthase, partial [Vibrio splendidus]